MSAFGFGSTNNNNNNSNNTFGTFGASNTGGFGANNASTGASLFGGNTATAGGGFSAFGANNNNSSSSPFGAAKPAFGAPATTGGGGGLFGNNTSTSGAFGNSAFGNSTNTGGFGSNTGGGLFGQSKPATGGFGSNNTGGSLFGGGASTGGFGTANNNATSTNNAFGSNTNSAFGNNNAGSGFAFGGASATATNNNNNNNNGTASAPFSAFSEKEPSSNQTSLYQSITFQPPYSTKSFEELRTEDYAQGRRFGNSNGQAGGFGQSTGFGGFGASNTSSGGGLFGNNTATSGTTAFGGNTGSNANNSAFGGFGSNNAGSVFGNKNSGTSLFGQQSSASTAGGFGSTAGSTGNLFGGSTSGFGANNNTNTNTAGSLFGANNNQQQNKPAFGGFGATNNTSAFGGSTNTAGGLFGNNTTNTNTNTAPAGNSLFGQNAQQQSNPFGSTPNNATSSLFGNQNKPSGSGLFGSNTNTATGTGLFGAQTNPPQQTNPFGQSTNTSSSLFGNQNQNKPAGTGLFGANANTASNPFGASSNQNNAASLFGGNANTGGSLFGNNNKPAGNSLFGAPNNAPNTNAGTSLFGNNQTSNSGSSLFGNQNNQNQQNSNSLFGGSFTQSQPAQNQLHASLTGAPYGNEQLFSSLAAPSPPVGPLATPLSGARPALRKTPSLLASARVNTPVYSPRAGSFGRTGGYGFSYSTYGTPGSAYTSGSLTPGASSLLKPTGSLSSALTSRLNKSLSTSNLRSDSTSGEGRSLLRPSVLSPEGTPGRYSSGNVRRLKIDRSLRTDLFGPEPKAIEPAKDGDAPGLRKMVSFENVRGTDSATPEANSSNALVRTEDEEENESPGLIRAGPSKTQSSGKGPEMEQVNGALTTVPEDTEAPRPSSAPGSKMVVEKIKRSEIGDYWTKPALKDLKNMSRQQLRNVGNFVVGREGVGRIEFGSVDLTNTPLEDICGNIVQLNPRSATVYQEDQAKPAMGKALNVPSTIYLENSWPRSHGGRKPVSVNSGKEYDKHIARLKRVGGTHFISYDPETGIWCFKVDHFTTYGLDDEDDDVSEYLENSQMMVASSPLSDAPETPIDQQDSTSQSVETNTAEMDDTFEFKLTRRSQLNLPGGFESEGMTYDLDEPSVGTFIAEESMMSDGLGDLDTENPFKSSGGPVQAPSPDTLERYHTNVAGDEYAAEEEHEIPGSFIDEPKPPRSILKPSATLSMFASPEKLAMQGWEEQLQRTLSPRKRDRQALKDMQQTLMRFREDEAIESPFKQSMLGQSYLAQKSAKKMRYESTTTQDLGKSQAFHTAMDLMDSMYAPNKYGSKATAATKGFEYPNPKKARLDDSNQLSADDAAWHESLKANFSNNVTLVYSVPASWPQPSEGLASAMKPFVGEHHDVRFAKLSTTADMQARALLVQKDFTAINVSDPFPFARTPEDFLFSSLAEHNDDEKDALPREEAIWHLCSILYDPLAVAGVGHIEGVPGDQARHFEPRMRKDALGGYWTSLVASSVHRGLKQARAAEEKALLHLSANDIVAACETLMDAKDYNLAMLVSQLPSTEQSRAMMKNQIEVWRSRNDWSEMSDAVRALYTLLAGELCVVEGNTGAAENRATTFTIAERFNLTWQQSFALRLHFGGSASIVETIESYVEDINAGRERIHPSETSPDGVETRSILMELLRLYAGIQESSALFSPRVASGSPLNSRLSWQLASLLCAKGACDVSPDELDQITYSFAMQSEAAGELVGATWTLLHIQDSQARLAAIATLMERHGNQISTPAQDARGTFEQLTEDYKIPSPLLWRAKALYAKGGLNAPGLQAEWLLRAGDVDAAHEVLCTTVGPKGIIEQDYKLLSTLLDYFEGRRVDGWEQGGQVYLDYLRLLGAQSSKRHLPDEAACVLRLQRGLAATEGERGTLEERVAAMEMGKVLEQQGDGGTEHAPVRARGVEGDMLRQYRQAMAV